MLKVPVCCLGTNCELLSGGNIRELNTGMQFSATSTKADGTRAEEEDQAKHKEMSRPIAMPWFVRSIPQAQTRMVQGSQNVSSKLNKNG